MEKLELKHLAGYLPYGLVTNYGKLIGIRNWVGWCGTFKTDFGENNIPISVIKPILRPLSDLTKEIEVNGEKFVPQKKLTHLDLEWLINSNDLILKTNYEDVLKLLEWHFDIHGLIEQGLAIDKNTL